MLQGPFRAPKAIPIAIKLKSLTSYLGSLQPVIGQREAAEARTAAAARDFQGSGSGRGSNVMKNGGSGSGRGSDIMKKKKAAEAEGEAT